jgi:hypothetical protein
MWNVNKIELGQLDCINHCRDVESRQESTRVLPMKPILSLQKFVKVSCKVSGYAFQVLATRSGKCVDRMKVEKFQKLMLWT